VCSDSKKISTESSSGKRAQVRRKFYSPKLCKFIPSSIDMHKMEAKLNIQGVSIRPSASFVTKLCEGILTKFEHEFRGQLLSMKFSFLSDCSILMLRYVELKWNHALRELIININEELKLTVTNVTDMLTRFSL